MAAVEALRRAARPRHKAYQHRQVEDLLKKRPGMTVEEIAYLLAITRRGHPSPPELTSAF
jgi:hypothetical protein